MKEPKLKTVYVCSNCGETSPRWMGRCPSCGSWNTMNEDVVAEAPKAGTAAAKQAAAARPEGVTTLTAKRLSEISMTEEKSRILTGISELDRLLFESTYRSVFAFFTASLPSPSPSVTPLPKGEAFAHGQADLTLR